MSRRLFKERYIKAKSATVKSRFSFRSAFLSGYRKNQNKKTAAYSPRNEFTTGRRPRPEKVAKFKLQAAFYCSPQINRAHAVPPTFASFFCFVLKTVTGKKFL